MRLLVMSCSARKTITPGLVPAIERYDGPLYQTYRVWERAAPRSDHPAILILSAEYGLIPARGLIPAYDRKMDEARAAQLAAGGITETDYTGLRMDTAGEEEPAFRSACFVGGKLYLGVMETLLIPFLGKTGLQPARVNGQIGYMRRDLRRWLES